MQRALKKGLGFGLTSGVITTLGLLVGLSYGTHSVKVVIAGILIIAFSDALSDAMGIHVAEEAEKRVSSGHVIKVGLTTFFSKLIFALTFLIPVLIWPLDMAVFVCIGWGMLLTVLFGFYVAKVQGDKVYKVVIEHLFLTGIVILVTYYIGQGVNWYLS